MIHEEKQEQQNLHRNQRFYLNLALSLCRHNPSSLTCLCSHVLARSTVRHCALSIHSYIYTYTYLYIHIRIFTPPCFSLVLSTLSSKDDGTKWIVLLQLASLSIFLAFFFFVVFFFIPSFIHSFLCACLLVVISKEKKKENHMDAFFLVRLVPHHCSRQKTCITTFIVQHICTFSLMN